MSIGGIFDCVVFKFNSISIGFIFRQELQSGVVELLIHTPNSFADVGSNTDRCTFFPLFLHISN